MPSPAPELVCPAGSLRALKLAVDAGADAVYLGLRNATNARNFAGLNFDDAQLREGVAYAHARGRKVLMALNTYARADDATPWQRRGRRGGRARRRRADRRRHGGDGLCARPPSGAAAAPVGAGLGDEPRGDRLLPPPLRHPARRAAARADPAAGGAAARAHRRSRSRSSASAACASWSRAAARCLPTPPASRRTTPASARRPRPCAGTTPPDGVEARLNGRPDRPLRQGRAARLPDAVQGPLRRRRHARLRARGADQPEHAGHAAAS